MNDESSRSHAIFQAIFTQVGELCSSCLQTLMNAEQIEETTEAEGAVDEARKRSEKVGVHCVFGHD